MNVLRRMYDGAERSDGDRTSTAGRRVDGTQYEINCDADPHLPEQRGWRIGTHQKMGHRVWNKKQQAQRLWIPRLRNARFFEAYRIARNMPILNARVADFLEARPFMIPEKWKGLNVFFPGTVFRYKGIGGWGGLYVRCLTFDSPALPGGWYLHQCNLDKPWGEGDAIALAA